MRHPLVGIVLGTMVVFTQGCSTGTSGVSPFVGTWQYDRLSAREVALASTIDSASGGDPESLSAAERADVRAWVFENHAKWDKTIVINSSGTFSMTSRVGNSLPEIIEGTWKRDQSGILLFENDGRIMASASLIEQKLVITPPGQDSKSGVMVMMPVVK